jgi:hypothetical protein
MPRCLKGHTYSSVGGCPLCIAVRPPVSARPKSTIGTAPPTLRLSSRRPATAASQVCNPVYIRGRVDTVLVRPVDSPAWIRWAFKATAAIVAFHLLSRLAINNLGLLFIVCALLIWIGSLSKVVAFVLGLAFRPFSSRQPHRSSGTIAFLRVDCGRTITCRLTGSEAVLPAQGDEVALVAIPTFSSRYVLGGRNLQTGRVFVTAALLPTMAGIVCVLFVVGALR